MAEKVPGQGFEFDLTLDASQHNAEFQGATSAAEQYAAKAGSAVEGAGVKMSQTMREVGHEAHSAMRAFERFIGIPAMFALIATEAYELGSKIREYIEDRFESATDKAEKFMLALNDKAPEERLKGLNEEIKKLTEQLGASRDSWGASFMSTFFGEGSEGAIEDRIKQLESEAQMLRAQKLKEQNDAEMRAEQDQAARARELRLQNIEQEAKTQDDAIRAREEGEVRIARLRDQLAKETDAAARAALEDRIRITQAQTDQEIAKAQQRAQKQAEDQRKAEAEKDKQVLDQRNQLEVSLLDGDEKIRVETEYRIAALRDQLNQETSEKRRRLLLEEIDFEYKQREKRMSDLHAKEYQEVKNIQRAVEEGNNNILYTLNALRNELSTLRYQR